MQLFKVKLLFCLHSCSFSCRYFWVRNRFHWSALTDGKRKQIPAFQWDRISPCNWLTKTVSIVNICQRVNKIFWSRKSQDHSKLHDSPWQSNYTAGCTRVLVRTSPYKRACLSISNQFMSAFFLLRHKHAVQLNLL